jgi:hypothetical protein
MKVVKVQYIVSEEFAKRNSENIKAVMTNLKESGSRNIRYSAFIADDKKSFTHLAVFKSEADEKILLNLEAFQKFQSELKASKPEMPPKVEYQELVGCSFDYFE